MRKNQKYELDDSILVVDSLLQASRILFEMVIDCDEFGRVSVGKLYFLLNKQTTFEDYLYGWKDLEKVSIIRVFDKETGDSGWKIEVPKVKHL